jgi:glycosyltransferase involved in cell wall biosynthesis
MLNPGYGITIETPEQLVQRYEYPREMSLALARQGCPVTVVQGFHSDGRFQAENLDYCLYETDRNRLSERSFFREGSDRRTVVVPELTTDMLNKVDELKADVVHVPSIALFFALDPLMRLCEELRVPVTGSYHGGLPAKWFWRRAKQRGILSRMSAFFFNSPEQADPWLGSGVIADRSKIVLCPETSSSFQRMAKSDCRAAMSIAGDPVFLWAGRLIPQKDPLTALVAFSKIVETRPEASLYIAYSEHTLLNEVRQFVSGQPALRDRVHLLPDQGRREMQLLMNAADFLLQTSLREVASRVVLEAMACGTIPVLSDIAAFRALTMGGCHGLLFPRGDAASMAAMVLKFLEAGDEAYADRVHRHFEEKLTFDCIARTYANTFRRLGQSPQPRS